MSGLRRGGFDESTLIFLKRNTMFEMKILTLKPLYLGFSQITIKTSAHVPSPQALSVRKLGITFLQSLHQGCKKFTDFKHQV